MRFHTSLPVENIDKCVAFYRVLFGAEPVKRKADYAKFLPPDLALNISFHALPALAEASGEVHLGLEVAGEGELSRILERLEAAGLSPSSPAPVTCCYARQNKFWVTDPDGHRWEIYALEADTPEKTDPAAPCCPEPQSQPRSQ